MAKPAIGWLGQCGIICFFITDSRYWYLFHVCVCVCVGECVSEQLISIAGHHMRLVLSVHCICVSEQFIPLAGHHIQLLFCVCMFHCVCACVSEQLVPRAGQHIRLLFPEEGQWTLDPLDGYTGNQKCCSWSWNQGEWRSGWQVVDCKCVHATAC